MKSIVGVLFPQDNTQEKAVNESIQKTNANLNLLYPLLKDKNIPTQCKMTIYTTILKPILIYGAEAWVMTERLKSKVNAAEMKILRLIYSMVSPEETELEIQR